MLNYIWGSIILVSIACAVFTGNIEPLSSSIMSGASDAINLIITMAGMMSLWTGLLKIAEEGGLTTILAKLLNQFSNIYSKIALKTVRLCVPYV